MLKFYFSGFNQIKTQKLKDYITLYKNLCELWFLKYNKISKIV